MATGEPLLRRHARPPGYSFTKSHLLEKRQHFGDEALQPFLIAGPVQEGPIQAHVGKIGELARDLFRRTDQGIAGPAGLKMELESLKGLLRHHLGLDPYALDDVTSRDVVALLFDVIVEEIARVEATVSADLSVGLFSTKTGGTLTNPYSISSSGLWSSGYLLCGIGRIPITR